MHQTTANASRRLPPARAEWRWLHQPIAPCELSPEGLPGMLLLNGLPYMVTLLGDLPERGPAVLRGVRITRPDGKVYDLTREPWGLQCNCPDATYRTRVGGCKHAAALWEALAPWGIGGQTIGRHARHNPESFDADQAALADVFTPNPRHAPHFESEADL